MEVDCMFVYTHKFKPRLKDTHLLIDAACKYRMHSFVHHFMQLGGLIHRLSKLLKY